jgi:hypothetical protein
MFSVSAGKIMVAPKQQKPNNTKEVKGRSMIFFGDSLTAGYGLGTSLAFPDYPGEARLSRLGYG